MAYTQIIRTQIIKKDINDLWDFMSSPKNLQRITPKWMGFKITSNNSNKTMYPGMIISYKVTPFLSIPIKWVTEITHVKEKKFFIDEQRIGPYKIWHHEHMFEQKEEGILMTDTIIYIPPFGVLGRIANYLFIKRRINRIFDYRSDILEELFSNSLE